MAGEEDFGHLPDLTAHSSRYSTAVCADLKCTASHSVTCMAWSVQISHKIYMHMCLPGESDTEIDKLSGQ